MTGRAGLGHVLEVTLPNPLPSHLDQAEVADGERFRAGAVAAQMHPKLLEDPVAVRLCLHVNEVADEDAAQIAQTGLSRQLARRLEVRLEDRLLRILLAGVAAG